MRFFDRARLGPRREPEPRPRRPAWIKPEAALPVGVPVSLILARTPEVALGLTGVLAYPGGFEFTLSVVRRTARHQPWFEYLRMHRLDDVVPDDVLRLGVAFADGRAATTLDRHPYGTDELPPAVLMAGSGGGGGRRYDMQLWVWPLPPPGPVAFICEWPAQAIPETRVAVDAVPILEAAARAVQLWPEDETL